MHTFILFLCLGFRPTSSSIQMLTALEHSDEPDCSKSYTVLVSAMFSQHTQFQQKPARTDEFKTQLLYPQYIEAEDHDAEIHSHPVKVFVSSKATERSSLVAVGGDKGCLDSVPIQAHSLEAPSKPEQHNGSFPSLSGTVNVAFCDVFESDVTTHLKTVYH
ncbi:hypothetical protein BaRGS_00009166 [Batillaria attramentaria]|uniref:Uncharacterized protein n=1 Tax=Batillaria attramentaria TaxID=370345 RepID=A0ABD0LJ17_9CAEN